MATPNVITGGTITPLGKVAFDPNTGDKLANGQTVAVTPGGNTYGSVPGALDYNPNSGHAPMGVAPTSTTTISNANKMNAVPGIITKNQNLSQTGITTDSQSGVATYANGEPVPPPPETTKAPETPATTTTGGYVGNTYYPPGSTAPLDDSGKPQPLAPTSTADDQITKNLNDMKAQADATTADSISLADATYKDLISQFEQQEKGYLSSYGSQYAPNNARSIMTSGLAQIGKLNFEKQQAINAAKAAGTAQDYQIMDKMNTKIADVADKQQKAFDDMQTQLAAKAKDIRDYNLNVAKFNQDISNTNFTQQLDTKKFEETVKSDAFDQAYKMEDLALKKQANSIAASTSLPVVQTTPSGAPTKASQDQFLASLPGGKTGAMGTAVQGLASYTIDPNTFSSRVPAGQTESQRQQLVTMAKQFDPTFDEKQYSARSAYLKNITSGNLATATLSANKATNHLLAFVNSMQKVNNGIIPALNKVRNAGSLDQSLHQATSTAQTEGLGVADELAKFFKGSGSTDVGSIDSWKKQISTSATPAEVKGLTQGAITLLAGQLDAMTQQYTNTMGKPPTSPLLQPETVAKLSQLKNQGYTVDIPGVLYTDKTAWQTKGGGTQDQWNQSVDVLTKSGLPLTDENILQMAQELNQ